MKGPKWAGMLLLGLQASAQTHIRDYDTRDYFALQLHPSTPASEVADLLGFHLEGPLGQIPNHFTFSCPKRNGERIETSLHHQRQRRKEQKQLERRGLLARSDLEHLPGIEGILWSEKQALRKRLVKRIPPPPLEIRQDTSPAEPSSEDAKALEEATQRLDDIADLLHIADPIFKEQWHLFNPIQLGHDLNVTGVWLQGITGNGAISAVVDDGLDMYSNDLKDNYYAAGSYDFNENTDEPKPRLFDDKHGTRCAGEIAAVRNNVCGVGMAYDSKVAGIRILSKPISDEDEALAINYKMEENDIYSCSWGPPDDGQTMEAPGLLIKKAMVNGVQQGRQGRGSVFVFAAGNGAASEDNCNFDGYTNSIYSITVGGIDRAGNHPYYSEKCSAQLVVTYSSGFSDAIHTTDVGLDKCYNGHGGTSAAGPLVVGTVALALSVRPDLSWRDLQYLCIDTAIPIHLEDSDWQDTKIGKKFSHTYGYGKIDAWRYVEAAKNFTSVKPQAWYHSPWLNVQHPIPQGDQGLASSFDVTADMLKTANLERLEHVTVTMNVNHTRRGDLSVELRSPEGLISHIATSRRNDAANTGYDDWTFMSVVHWGESGVGTWTIIAKDTQVNENNGTFIDWRLNLWGECIDPAIQQLHHLPDVHDDDHEVADAPVSTTSVDPGSPPTDLPANPSDHIDRPVKPSATSSATTTTEPTPASTQGSPSSEPSPTHTPSDSFLPSFFPTFGVSKRTQIWIYGAMGLIISFVLGLGVYFYWQRKKRLRNDTRGEYNELPELDRDGRPGVVTGNSGNRNRRRGGELYDAFAGESDEDFLSDTEDEPYQDGPQASAMSHSRESLNGP